MADEETLLNADEKKCKYCKSNVEKSFVKCLVCDIVYHSSCALRITGLRVAKGSKGLITCSAICANAIIERDLQDANKIISLKNLEIENLKDVLNKLQSSNEQLINEFQLLKQSMQSMEVNISQKIEQKIEELQQKTTRKEDDKQQKTQQSDTSKINNDFPVSQPQKNQSEADKTAQNNIKSVGNRSGSDIAAVDTRNPSDTIQNNEDSEGFQFQNRRKYSKRQLSHDKNEIKTKTTENNTKPDGKQEKPPRKKKAQLGVRENNDNDFMAITSKSGKKKIWIYISKVKEGITEENIKKYITKQTSTAEEDIYVKVCIPKVQKSRGQKFMIGVPPELQEPMYKAEFWPVGVAYERFNFGLGRNFLARAD